MEENSAPRCENPNCIPCLTEKLESAVLIHGPQHPLTAQLCYELGRMNQAKGDLEASLGYFERSLEIRQAALGNKAEETIDSRYRIGVVLAMIGEISESELISHRLETLKLRQAFDSSDFADGSVQIARKNVGFMDSTLIYNDVAGDALARFDFDTADDLYMRSITLRRKKFGHKSPAVSKVLINYAESKRLQGELDEAEGLRREASLINRELMMRLESESSTT